MNICMNEYITTRQSATPKIELWLAKKEAGGSVFRDHFRWLALSSLALESDRTVCKSRLQTCE